MNGSKEPKVIYGKDIQFIPASHEDPTSPGVYKKILAHKEDLLRGTVQMINWAMMPLGASFVNHYHEDMEETFIIISGRVEMLINNQRYVLTNGDAVIVPPLTPHRMTNIGEAPVEYMVVGITLGKGGKTVLQPS